MVSCKDCELIKPYGIVYDYVDDLLKGGKVFFIDDSDKNLHYPLHNKEWINIKFNPNDNLQILHSRSYVAADLCQCAKIIKWNL